MSKAFLLSCLACILLHASALYRTYENTKSSKFGEFITQDFGMAVGGTIEINYDVGPQDAAQKFDSYVILVVATHDQVEGWYSDMKDSDGADSGSVSTLCAQPSTFRQELIGTGSLSYKIDYSIGENRFSVGVLQCRAGYESNPVSVNVELSMMNPRPQSTEMSHYSIEHVMTIRVLEGELIIYALMILGMAGQIYLASRTNRRYARSIHTLFLVTLIAVFVYMFVKYGASYRYNLKGTDSRAMTMALNIFNVISNTCLLTSLLMLSLGWSLIRADLSENEYQLAASALGAYFIFGIAGGVCLDENATTCQALSLVPFVLQSIILLAVIIAMNFSVTQLRAMVGNSPWVPSTPLQYARLKQYNVFRLMFLLYLLLPTAFLIFDVVVLTWKEDWVAFLLTELLDIAIIFHVGVNFSPLHETLMIRAFDGSVIGQEPAHERVE